MISFDKAPGAGICYALYSDKGVIFEKYTLPIDVDEMHLLELHLFDEEKELRVIRTETKGLIECLITDTECKHDDIYEEQVFTEKNIPIKIVNYITYNENDTLNIDNYRLKEVRV